MKRHREQARWAKAYREEQEIEQLDGVIDARQAELRTLLQQIGGIEARYPGDVRLIGMLGASEVEMQRERVKMLDEKIAKAQRTIARRGLPAPESEA